MGEIQITYTQASYRHRPVYEGAARSGGVRGDGIEGWPRFFQPVRYREPVDGHRRGVRRVRAAVPSVDEVLVVVVVREIYGVIKVGLERVRH